MDLSRQDEASAALDHHAREWQADLLHLHLPSQAAGIKPGRRIIAVAHSCQPTWWAAAGEGPIPDAWLPLLQRTRTGLARADRVLTPTRAHADTLEEIYGPQRRLSVIPNAAAPPPPGPPPIKQLTALAAGRWWDSGKNGRVLDQAAPLTQVPIDMAGPLQGPEGSTLRLHHARPVGDLPNQTLRDRMAAAAIFVSPSLYEPFGLAVLEAALHGCALVLSDTPTFRELWGSTALYAEPRDPTAFARAIDRLAADPDHRARLGHAARQRAGRYTPSRQRADIIAAYNLVLARAA
jgi:glycosyltransferase involved in cell wall biosynthesis